ncbi:MAG: 1-deoxy-D-xylulose-5-phosphate reductoisomerase [Variibacter sp.]
MQAATARPPVRKDREPLSITVLGATGSIGKSTIDLLQRNPDKYRVEAVTANTNAAPLAKIARELGARLAVIADPAGYGELKDALSGTGIEAASGAASLVEAAARPADWVMAAIMGSSGLEPTLAAVERGRTVALANKECLVCAGDLFMRQAKARGATVLPVDSEHNAIFQAMGAGHAKDVVRIIVTASGGPFRTWEREAIEVATREQALKHPNWSMGQKITIDSASMMNKGLEIIEAHYLFGLPSRQIEVLVHPQSVVHGLVEFRDGSMIAALGSPDMRIPIAHCLAWPDRIDGPVPKLDLAQVATLTFEEADLTRFPALALARTALETKQGAPTVLNAANEVAVAEFLGGRIGFGGIARLAAAVMERAARQGVMHEPASIEDALTIDRIGRDLARDILPEIAANAV